MYHTECHHCQTTIPNGEAVIRSIAFERVAFHLTCAVRLGIVSRPVVAA